MPVSRPAEVRFWTKVIKGDIDRCWISCIERIKVEDNKVIPMYQFSYLLHYPIIFPIDFKNFEIIHYKCSNKSCVNPNHLRLEMRIKNKINDYKK